MNTSKLIAAAILGDDIAKEKALRQITCQTAAAHAMVCACGAIHDQKKIHVIEIVHPDKSEQTLSACCPACFEKNLPAIRRVVANVEREAVQLNTEAGRVRVATWKQFIYVNAE